MQDTTHPAAADVASGGERSGMGLFTLVWIGQVVSALGTALSSFALGVKIFQETGSVTRFGLVAVAMIVPNLLFSPIAGVLADRWDRRRLLIASHFGSALCTLLLLRLIVTDQIQAWHVYPVIFTTAAFSSFVWPTFTAATTLMVGKANLGRAAGMNQLGTAVTQLIAPLAAGVLLVTIGLRNVILVDIATFGFAAMVLLAVRFPITTATAEGRDAAGTFRQQMLFGWHYIRARPGLFYMLLLAAGLRSSVGLVETLITPLVLSFASPITLGLVLSIAASGLVVGSIAVSVWGAPQRRVETILWVMVVQGMLLMLGGLRPSATLIASASFCFLVAFPLATAAGQAIWQSKVAVDIQGRVFATRRMVGSSMVPLALALAGPLADRFEPLMAANGALAGSAGQAIGVGPGRGIGLLLMLNGVVILGLALIGFRLKRLRNVEIELPDAEGVPDQPARTARNERERSQWVLARVPAMVVLILLVVLAAVSISLQRPPSVVPETASPEVFSAARAFHHVDVLAAQPRPFGSAAHAAARAYIVAELESLGLEVAIQEARSVQATRGVVQVADVINVLARLPGTAASPDTVLLAAHYDTVLGSRGAGDDASGVAVLLETARALAAGSARRNDLVFLFSDGEETGLHGARAFVEQHPWADDVDVVLNFEARGRGGPSFMFQTGPDNDQWMKHFFAVVPHPIASSLMNQIYQRLPNDTDFTVFLQDGIPGYNFAFIEGLTHYHTALDRPQDLDPQSVQHHGDYASTLAAHLADVDLSAVPAKRDRTYFNLLGSVPVHYPWAWALVFALIALLTAAAAIRRGRQLGDLTLGGTAQGFLIFFGMLVTVTVAVTLVWFVIRDVAGVAILGGSTVAAGRFMAAFACLALAAALAVYSRSRKLTAGADLAAGALVWWMLMVVLTMGVWLPVDSGFLFVWPVLFTGLGLLWIYSERRKRMHPWIQAAVLGASLVPGVLLIAPFTAATYTGLQGLSQLGGLGLLPGLLFIGLVYPLLNVLPLGWLGRLAGVAGVVGVVLLGLALRTSAGEGAVRSNSVMFAEDHDGKTSRWLSFELEPDEWTANFGFASGVMGSLEDIFPVPFRDLLQADAPYVGLQPPAVSWVDLGADGEVRRLRIDFDNPFGSRARLLWFEPGEAVTSVRLGDLDLPVRTAAGQPQARLLRLLSDSRSEALEVTVTGDAPVRLVVVEQRVGLPEIAGFEPRPASMVPRPLFTFLDSDVSLVRRSIMLERDSGGDAP